MQKQFDVALTGLLNGFVPPAVGSDWLLAVSGGIDSVCMADLFLHSSVAPGFALAHCNFHLRGEESEGDAAFVAAWAAERGLRLHSVDFDTLGYAAEHGLSIEMAARELRYGWFASLCREYGYGAVCTAHNADDNAETLFLNLVRGTGLGGICGMKAVATLPYSAAGTAAAGRGDEGAPMLLRPMLGFTRKQIEGYLWKHSVKYRVDSSNADSAYRRNKIRNEVFPLLKSMNPSLIKTLNREMAYFAEIREMLDGLLAPEVSALLENTGDGVRISVPALLAYKHWKYLLFRLLEPYGFNSSSVASVEDLLLSYGQEGFTFSGKTFTSPAYSLLTASDALLINPLPEPVKDGDNAETEDFPTENKDSQTGNKSVIINGEGDYMLGCERFSVRLVPRSEVPALKAPRGIIIMDADKCTFPFTVRRWRQGDWFRPLGMKGKKKVSDLFTDLKYNLHQKASALIMTSSQHDSSSHILAVLGERIDDSLKVAPSTSRCMIISSGCPSGGE